MASSRSARSSKQRGRGKRQAATKTIRGLAEFDAELRRLVAHMQTPKAKRAVEAAFGSSPVEMGRVAVEAARKKR